MDSLDWVRALTFPSIVVAFGASIFMFSKAQEAMPKFSASFSKTSESFEELKANCRKACEAGSDTVGDKDLGDLLHEEVDSFGKFCVTFKPLFDDDGLLDANKFCMVVRKSLDVSKTVDADLFCLAVQRDLASCDSVDVNEFCRAVERALSLSQTSNASKFCEDIQKGCGVEISMDLCKFFFYIKKALNRWALHKNLESCKKSWAVFCGDSSNG